MNKLGSRVHEEHPRNVKAAASNAVTPVQNIRMSCSKFSKDEKNQIVSKPEISTTCELLNTCGQAHYCERCRSSVKLRQIHRYFSSARGKKFSRFFPRSLYYCLILSLAFLPTLPKLMNFSASILIVSGCRPGLYGGKRLMPKQMVPVSFRQHVPNVSEKTIGASGPTEGKIMRDSKRFREELITNLNPNIVFKDEEQTNADRMMTERCRDRLNRLAMMVSEHWKNQVKLRVTEAWDEDGAHEPDSLHYEGRAVDITTTDRDRRKYGMLARLAVEAGFDWVYYESRAHIHCSVKADKSDAARYGGCFAGDTYASRPNNEQILMSELSPGDEILAVDDNGGIVPDRVLTFMDRRILLSKPINAKPLAFRRIMIDSGREVTLTANHLIKALPSTEANFSSPTIDISYANIRARYTFAKSIRVGDFIFVAQNYLNDTRELAKRTLSIGRVVSVDNVSSETGAFAPLTERGTILVNGIAASCYAVIENHDLAHFVMSPMRYFFMFRNWQFSTPSGEVDSITGVSWYPRFLYYFGSIVLPESSLYI